MTRYAALPEPEVGVWLRLYIYGLHGFLIEVLFTAVWDFVVHRDWALVGEYRWLLCMFILCSGDRDANIFIFTSRVIMPALI